MKKLEHKNIKYLVHCHIASKYLKCDLNLHYLIPDPIPLTSVSNQFLLIFTLFELPSQDKLGVEWAV